MLKKFWKRWKHWRLRRALNSHRFQRDVNELKAFVEVAIDEKRQRDWGNRINT